ncbi:putative uncharacterized domain protein (plasmid) [Borreliella afzelii PKo]|uniref:Uncharacterized domain protein n=2 Tax=Borreliella afzelii TaxID=29518 RepID=G0ITT1_BORAP|nr:putative uncharacterized domain protein [Borreliella afzelii PKo]MBB5141628.1 hypothetical protein [Borreliella afzelii]
MAENIKNQVNNQNDYKSKANPSDHVPHNFFNNKIEYIPKGHPNDRDSHRYNFPFKTKKGFEEGIYNLYILPKYLLAIWKKNY